ncbi:hypothetical protein [Deinococcus misasensis]|uniref:hypothetical protein n=1 Tax=Deinococcus misasensis TaxID=392413 RepID=UPI00054EBAB5|nr:hypothetical protein [Deinococcus misasensis]
MTWQFNILDALLMVLWAGIAVLGYKRGVGGAIWALVVFLLLPIMASFGTITGWVAVLITLVVGFGFAQGLSFLVRNQVESLTYKILGGVMGGLLGSVLVTSVVLSFPISASGSYPSQSLQPAVYEMVSKSQLQRSSSWVWSAPSWVQLFVVPDRVQRQ